MSKKYKDYVVKLVWDNSHFEMHQFNEKHNAINFYWAYYPNPFVKKAEYIEFGYTKMINGILYSQPTFEVV